MGLGDVYKRQTTTLKQVRIEFKRITIGEIFPNSSRNEKNKHVSLLIRIKVYKNVYNEIQRGRVKVKSFYGSMRKS